jgi:hypothetical protein
MESRLGRRAAAYTIAFAVLCAVLCAAVASPALGAGTVPGGYARIEPACPAPAQGEASCFALGRVPVAAREAARPGVSRVPARPAALSFGPAGGLTPALLASAYGYDPSAGGVAETVAIVDAFDDPNIESDLEEFSTHYGLPPCTAESGCFRKVGQTGSSTELPAPDTKGWSVEISLDVETVHAACPKCRILLVESKNALMTNLGTAVTKAVEMGADVVSNSYGGPEQVAPSGAERALFEHPGVVITAATGDFGYDWWTGPLPDPETTNLPASMPGVVSVGGTTLNLNGEGTRAAETVWNGNGPLNEGEFEAGVSGGGCSVFFEAPVWQRFAAGYPATGCGDKRLSADVAAVADPFTGFDIYDTYECGFACSALKGASAWSTIGGTSLSTPLIGALYALAGGADAIKYPSLTLYAHLGDPSLFDVKEGGNGYCDDEGRACGVNAVFGEQLDCEGTTACNAAPGYDGPSGVGAPASIEAFHPLPEEERLAAGRGEAARKAEEAAQRAAEEARRRGEEEAAQRAAEEARRAAEAAARARSGQGTAGFKAEKAAVPNATLRGTRLHAGPGGSITVRVGCPAGERSCEGSVTVRTLSAVIAGPGARASVLTLASGRFRVAGGHVVAVRLRLTQKGRALLARRGSLRVRVVISAHDPAGASHMSHAAATLYAFRRG